MNHYDINTNAWLEELGYDTNVSDETREKLNGLTKKWIRGLLGESDLKKAFGQIMAKGV